MSLGELKFFFARDILDNIKNNGGETTMAKAKAKAANAAAGHQHANQYTKGAGQNNQQAAGAQNNAKQALSSLKFEIARELGINLKQGYNGDLSSRENGYVGGYMVKRLIQQAEKQIAGKQQ
jgi:pyruvate/2-oxoglutarate dehydrogenase complex dihydrolipoamide acyltransferase (E2) component